MALKPEGEMAGAVCRLDVTEYNATLRLHCWIQHEHCFTVLLASKQT
jgi:hypothetical protein